MKIDLNACARLLLGAHMLGASAKAPAGRAPHQEAAFRAGAGLHLHIEDAGESVPLAAFRPTVRRLQQAESGAYAAILEVAQTEDGDRTYFRTWLSGPPPAACNPYTQLTAIGGVEIAQLDANCTDDNATEAAASVFILTLGPDTYYATRELPTDEGPPGLSCAIDAGNGTWLHQVFNLRLVRETVRCEGDGDDPEGPGTTSGNGASHRAGTGDTATRAMIVMAGASALALMARAAVALLCRADTRSHPAQVEMAPPDAGAGADEVMEAAGGGLRGRDGGDCCRNGWMVRGSVHP